MDQDYINYNYFTIDDVDIKKNNLNKLNSLLDIVQQQSINTTIVRKNQQQQQQQSGLRDITNLLKNNDDFGSFMQLIKKNEKKHKRFCIIKLINNFEKHLQRCSKQKVSNLYRNFINDLVKIAIREKLISINNDKQVDWFQLNIETLLMKKTFKILFNSFTADELKYDLDISRKVKLLKQFVNEDVLNVPKCCRNEVIQELCKQALREMDQQILPYEKLKCIENACNILLNTIRLTTENNKGGADMFIPSFINIILKSNIKHLWLNCEFINRFIDSKNLTTSKQDYCFANLKCAINFIETANALTLNITVEEFQTNIQKALLTLKE